MKLATTLIDGQNLFGCIREQFGYKYANFDPHKLAQVVCGQEGWTLGDVRFYSGVPSQKHLSDYHRFWKRKQQAMQAAGVITFMPELRHGTAKLRCPKCRNLGMVCDVCGRVETYQEFREKAVDVRLALDLVNAALSPETEVLLLFSQDQDFSEAVQEARNRLKPQGRRVEFVCVYPSRHGSGYHKPAVFGMRGLPMEKQLYDSAIDPNTYGLRLS